MTLDALASFPGAAGYQQVGSTRVAKARLAHEAANGVRRRRPSAEKMAPTHPHPHAPESALGNILAGPFVAIADKVRGAIRSTKNH